jgi:hypothetical protein
MGPTSQNRHPPVHFTLKSLLSLKSTRAGHRALPGLHGPVGAASEVVHTRGDVCQPLRRKLFADYLTDARQTWTPGVTISLAWVRQVPDCSRGLSSRLADALAAEVEGGVKTRER